MNNTKEFTPHPSIPCKKCGNSFMYEHSYDWEGQLEWLQFWVSNETRLPSIEEVYVDRSSQRDIITTADILGKVQQLAFKCELANLGAILIQDDQVKIFKGDQLLLLYVYGDEIEMVEPLQMKNPFTLEELHTFLEKWLT